MRTVLSSCSMPVIRWGCLVLCVVLAVTQGAVAHAPSDIDVNFNAGTRVLSVTITHQVADPATHYVKEVTVRHADTVFVEEEYTSQPSPDTFTYSYPIPSDVTGIIEVKAECSIDGEKTKALAIGTYTPPSTPAGATQTGTTPPATVTQTAATSPGTTEPAPSPSAGALAVAALGALAVLAAWRVRR